MNDQTTTLYSWKQAWRAHLLLLGYWWIPSSSLDILIQNDLRRPQAPKKLLFFTLSHIFISSLLAALVVQAIFDGPEFLHYYLRGNVTAWSQMFFMWAGYVTLIYWSAIGSIAVIIPFIELWIVNRCQPKAIRLSGLQVFILSSYGFLVIILFSPVVYAIGFIVITGGIQPQLVHLEDATIWNEVLYTIIALPCIGQLATLRIAKKILGKKDKTLGPSPQLSYS